VRAYSKPGCCLSTSATAYDVRALTGALVSSQGRWPRPSSFSDASRGPLAKAVTRGEPRYVRAIRPRCRLFPLAQAFPTAISHRRGTPERFWRSEFSCRLTCTGLWTERRTCPRAWGALFARLPGRVRTLSARRRRSPPSATRGHPFVASPRGCGGRDLRKPNTDRSRPTLHRQPAKAVDILWIRVPSTVATRVRARITPHRFPSAGPSLTPPTR
jgi:hypothetical protein